MTTQTPPVARISKVEYRNDTRYTAVAAPRLSWVTETTTPDWVQDWAEIDRDGDVRRVDGRDSVHVPWPFTPLAPRETARVRVRVAGNDGAVSDWSEPREIEAGFLNDGDWIAELVGLASPSRIGQPTLLRREFDLRAQPHKATLYAMAQGVYQVHVNGTEVDEQTLKPGWTSYATRNIHETTDVTALLSAGPNAIGVELAGGWFTESYGFGEDKLPFYGEQPAAALQVVVEYEDGTSETLRTDTSWRALADAPILSASIYDGQNDDLRLTPHGWSLPGFDDAGWEGVTATTAPVPLPRIAPPVREIAELDVVEASTAPSGVRILDFGQNISGRLRVRADLPAGTRVTITHAEVLSADGELERTSMKEAITTDSFISAGEAVVWEPRFTFRGFRYASIEGWVGEIPAGAITAVAISSDLERTGWFESSDPLVDKLHDSVLWSMRDNFVSLPTDCPQRDERLGWTGDIMWFAPTGATLFDIDGFLANWMGDVAAEQTEDSSIIPFVVPSPVGGIAAAFSGPVAAWGDVATVVPWVLYQRYADVGILRTQYESMTGWVDAIERIAGESRLWKGGFQFGDWLDPFTPPEFPTEAKADAELVATAYFYQSASILSQMAEVLGEVDDAARYARLAAEIRAAFTAEYVTANGRVTSEAQTAYALAIVFGLAEDDAARDRMGAHLANLVREGGYHIGTGFAGTPFLTEALTMTGHIRAADRMLMQTECPSWLYPITMGATTTWEAWDSLRPDGTINPRGTSFNHYAFGSVVDWLYRSVAGLGPQQPGYREIAVAPVPLPSLDRAAATHLTPYGTASVAWERDGDTVMIRAIVPANTTASVQLPDGSPRFTVGSGEHVWTVTDDASAPRVEGLSLKTDLASVMEDRGAYQAVLAAYEKHIPWAAPALRTHHTHWRAGEPLESSIFFVPARVRGLIDQELAQYTVGR